MHGGLAVARAQPRKDRQGLVRPAGLSDFLLGWEEGLGV